MNQFSDRSILITGCSSGIGLEAAKALHQRGYRVFATARESQSLAMLKSLGVNAVSLDTRDSASIRTAMDYVANETQGRLYAVFHNAGYGQSGALEDLSRDALREQFEGNVFGVHELNTLIIPMMRKHQQGRIIINTSVLGYIAQKYKGAYIASKYALEGMADTLRLELWDTDIHVSMIEPGPIASAFRKHSLAAFKRHVDPAKSVHAKGYKILLEKLAFEGSITKWTLPASACVPPLIAALENPAPKARYRVTFPAKLMAAAKRVLPAHRLDRILLNGL